MNLTYIVLGVLLVLALVVVLIYNKLVVLRNRTNEAWSDIDVQLKRRYDLIPNLVEVVKGYAAHEKSVLKMLPKQEQRLCLLSSQEILKR